MIALRRIAPPAQTRTLLIVLNVAIPAAVLFGYEPLLGIAATIAVIGIIAAIRIPLAMLLVAQLSIAVSLDLLKPFLAQGGPIAQQSRMFIFVAILPILIARGFRNAHVPLPVIAYGAVFLFTFTLSHRFEALSLQLAFVNLALLCLPWLASQIKWRSGEARTVLIAIALVAPLSVLIGIPLDVLGWHQLYPSDFTGVPRLRGSVHAASLALIGTGGVAAGAALDRLGWRRRAALLIIANFVIVGLTATRGGLLACTIVLVPYVVRVVRTARSPELRTVSLIGMAGVIAIAAAIYIPPLLERGRATTYDASQQGNVATSGRSEAWKYFISQAHDSQSFGRGLGSSPLIGEAAAGELPGDFRAPHNEYIRTYLETGIFGTFLIFGAIVVYLAQLYRWTVRYFRPDLVALVVAFFVYALTDNPMSGQHLSLAFGLIIGLYATLGLPSSARSSGDWSPNAAVFNPMLGRRRTS